MHVRRLHLWAVSPGGRAGEDPANPHLHGPVWIKHAVVPFHPDRRRVERVGPGFDKGEHGAALPGSTFTTRSAR